MTSRAASADFNPWRGTLGVAVGQMVAWGTLYYSYAVVAPALARAMDVPRHTIALGFSMTLLVSGTLARHVGRRMDAHGTRAVLVAGAVLGPGALLMLASADHLATVWVAFAVLGVSHALALYEPAFRAVVSWFRGARERRRALLLVTSVGGLASAAFTPIATALLMAHGWRAALAALAVVLLAIGLPIALATPDASLAVPSPARDDAVGHRQAAGPGVRRLAVAFGAHAFASAALAVALLWHLAVKGMPMANAAVLVGLAGAAQVPGRLLIGVAQELVDDTWRVPAGFLAQAVALTLIAFTDGMALVLAVLVFGAASGAMTLERAAMTAKWFGVDRFGRVSGEIASVGLVGRAAAPFVVELVGGPLGYDVMLAGTAALLAAAGLTFAVGHGARTAPAMSAATILPVSGRRLTCGCHDSVDRCGIEGPDNGPVQFPTPIQRVRGCVAHMRQSSTTCDWSSLGTTPTSKARGSED